MTEELRLGNPDRCTTRDAGRAGWSRSPGSRSPRPSSARPSEVIFTSGGTEADNLAVKGVFWARRAEGLQRRRVLITATEHHAVLDSANWLASHDGAEICWLDVDGTGLVSAEHPARRDRGRPGQRRAGQRHVGEQRGGHDRARGGTGGGGGRVPGRIQHDAVQAAAQVPVHFADSGADALTITGHKLGGPVGAGALLLARGAQPVPVLHGGGQESDIRSGTLDAPAIRAFATAAQVVAKTRESEAIRLAALRDDLVARVRAAVPDATAQRRAALARGGCRATCTSPSPDVRATPCSCSWTRGGSPAPPGRHAPPGLPGPVTRCSPWVPTRRGPEARCDSRSARRLPRPIARPWGT